MHGAGRNISRVCTTGNHQRWCGAHWLRASCMIMFGAKSSIALISHYFSSWTSAILIGESHVETGEHRKCTIICAGSLKKAWKRPLLVMCSVTNMSATASCVFPPFPLFLWYLFILDLYNMNNVEQPISLPCSDIEYRLLYNICIKLCFSLRQRERFFQGLIYWVHLWWERLGLSYIKLAGMWNVWYLSWNLTPENRILIAGNI